MNRFSDISWISISVKGTKVKIEVTETIEKTQVIDRTTPCDIVAAKNGLIVSIVTNAGTPKVKAKDVVEQGDLLVSGQLLIGEGAEQKIEYVHASAQIKAKLWYEFDLSEYIKYNEKIYTGQTKKGYNINIMLAFLIVIMIRLVM
jgi:similar to stage IV sporulation protein